MKAQQSMEYIMIVGIGLLILVPTAYFIFSRSSESESQIDSVLINRVGNDIATNAESIYYHGYPSKVKIEAKMPKNVVYIELYRDWSQKQNEIIFWSGTSLHANSFSVKSNVNLLGFFDDKASSHGTKVIRFFASQDNANKPFVLIVFGGRCDISTDYDTNNDKAVGPADFTKCSGAPCFNSDLSGGCEDCDYDGDCTISNTDLSLWNVLTKSSTQPRASISGPTSIQIGSPATFSVNAQDPENDINNIVVFRTPLAGGNPVQIGSCASSPCSVQWTPAGADAGSYQVFTLVTDSTGLGCSGNPSQGNSGYPKCGFKDLISVGVR